MNAISYPSLTKRVTSTALLCAGLVLLAGCQSKSPVETAKKSESTVPKTEEPVPEKKTESEKTEKTAEPKISAKAAPDLPPAPPSTEELALVELKKLGGKAEVNRNDNVVEVIWQGPEVTDNHLVILQKFTYLRKLDLTETSITDAGLKHLKGLEWLRYLFLLGTPITDAGVAELQGHNRLEQLCLDETLVTDKGVKLLEPLGNLVMLHLATQGEITDACIDSLIKLEQLHEIKLEGTKITEDGKARLVKANPEIEFIGGPDGAIPID
jgi:hypothetical protein